ncbi:MAG: thiamine pyrophosphate-dependent dehydrogenase E1 component subunit alpha [Candidatus Riflebacteria bacterium]|nr:thiamine pyrophosphate-dependent dehydrogenase E1 component subunit alpha [Candidatus Riflebacteria bacterium]
MTVDKKTALELYSKMLLIRFCEESIAARYHSEKKMRCPTHLSTGQEAVPAAAGQALRSDDFVVSTHRSHGHYLGKGGDLNRMIAEIHGKKSGCSRGWGGSMHLIDRSVGFVGSTAIVAGTIPVGVGLGLSIKLKKTDQVSCVFLGDAATEEGVFYESVNFAVVKQLPVLFICENNLYSVYSHLKVRQPEGRSIASMVQGMGCSAVSGNGNDVAESYEKISTAVASIRNGNGPVFLEFATYRWREHCGPDFDNHIGYRSEEEFKEWKKKDPVEAFENKLLLDNVIDKSMIDELKSMTQALVDNAFELADRDEFPDFYDNSVFKEVIR